MSNIVPFSYQGQPVRFNADGWLHATKIAERFGKRLDHWLENAETLEYIRALDEILHPDAGPSKILNTRNSGYLKTSRGKYSGGTWLHPKLAVAFARWLDARFAVWCDMQIDALLHGGGAIRQHYESACRNLENGQAKASMSASDLAKWRWRKPGLEHEVDHWREQMQLVLGLE